MGKRNKKRIQTELPSFSTIKAASEGDVEAVNSILEYYGGYIVKLSSRRAYDAYGNRHDYVDETLRRRLETKLIMTVLNFNV